MSTSRNDEMRAREDASKQARRAYDPVEKLRLYCLSKGYNGIRSLGRQFRGMDDDGDRKLPKEEFIRGLSSYGVEMSRREMEQIFDAMDKDRSGTINFDEFLEAMRPPMSKRRKDVVMDAFDAMDRSGDGYITTEDLQSRLDMGHNEDVVKGKKSSKEAGSAFLRNFEGKNGDGTVTQDEFLNYYAGVSASVDSDEYFQYIIERAYRLGEFADSRYDKSSGGRSRRNRGRDRSRSPSPRDDDGRDHRDNRRRDNSREKYYSKASAPQSRSRKDSGGGQSDERNSNSDRGGRGGSRPRREDSFERHKDGRRDSRSRR